MTNSTWLNNNKINFSIVEVKDKSYIVATCSVGKQRLLYIEDLVTKDRYIPTVENEIHTGAHLDDIVLKSIEEIEKKN
ncbi:hypothetical protein AWH56_009020 [Anaerobacillus isosaccharinicus]|uniref:Uncharacterized protein n=1 Tax=Anaerobacillus isosaccharinicus TaxID=1532552 RepID=A0A1S2M9A2_9BACI|nr:hypothetical protein [Anaerobacillus isosaccharinicus]MBA5588893.1 hypothetical protein [Anaerobacillus isosaccharinicus]QOY37703.1 hypothetical protein AWH56_009020 [Anaerobacillus isosaccharinicus]